RRHRPLPGATPFPYTPLFRSYRPSEVRIVVDVYGSTIALGPASREVRSTIRRNSFWISSDGRASRTISTMRPRSSTSGGSILRRSEEHTSELQSRENLVCRLL